MYDTNQIDLKNIRRCEIYFAELNGEGSQQKGKRPVIIYSNDRNNIESPTVNVIPMTTKTKDLCVHVTIAGCGLREKSIAIIEQITTINKTQLLYKIGTLTDRYVALIDDAVDLQLGRKKVLKEDNPFAAV